MTTREYFRKLRRYGWDQHDSNQQAAVDAAANLACQASAGGVISANHEQWEFDAYVSNYLELPGRPRYVKYGEGTWALRWSCTVGDIPFSL